MDQRSLRRHAAAPAIARLSTYTLQKNSSFDNPAGYRWRVAAERLIAYNQILNKASPSALRIAPSFRFASAAVNVRLAGRQAKKDGH